VNVVAYGAGTNSTALVIECYRRGITIDAILFSDTGGERPETYTYLKMFSEWCVANGLPAIETLRYKSTRRGDQTLEGELLRRGALPSVAYGGFKTCSLKWKLDPQLKWIRRQGEQSWPVTTMLGIDAGEAHRARNLSADKLRVTTAPLVEWDIDREDCEKIILAVGLPLPGKSSCFFCPNMKAHEIEALRVEHPDLYDRALAIEDNAVAGRREGSSIRGLARNKSWREVHTTDKLRGSMFDEPCISCVG
jgi:hypothetical protein